MFLDEAIIEVRSGRGGDGAATFHREKHVPRGGPDGGDGGSGGDVHVVTDAHLTTLLDYRYKTRFSAEDGANGRGNKRKGKNAAPVELRVPIGTIVKDAETDELLADLAHDGARLTVCRGGRGGRGNVHFTTSTRQAPTFAEKGEPGERLRLKLELKLMADVGLVGLPNAGKSTLIGAVSAAKPKVADYPFTTLTPNLGIVRVGDRSFVMADLPGLIEGASEGKGLGDRFLRHAERTRVIVHLAECRPLDGSDPLHNFEVVQQELRAFSAELVEKPSVIALTKVDLVPEVASRKELTDRLAAAKLEVFPISAVTGEGVDALLYRLCEVLDAHPPRSEVQVLQPQPDAPAEDEWSVTQENRAFVVTGRRLARMVAMTDLENDEAVRHLHRRLQRMGVLSRLRQVGAAEGDTVRIGGFEFTFLDEE